MFDGGAANASSCARSISVDVAERAGARRGLRLLGQPSAARFPLCAVHTLDLLFRTRELRSALGEDIYCNGETWRAVAIHPVLASRERRE
jgi:hypothetical protein